MLRLFDAAEPNRPAYNLLCHELALLDADAGLATPAQGLASIRLITDLAPRARELVSLAPYVQEPLRANILQEALDTVMTIKDEYARLDALVELSSSLSEELLWQVLETIPAIEDEADRAGTLIELAPSLSSHQALLEKFLAFVQEMQDEEYRALALGVCEALWIRQLLSELHLLPNSPVMLYCDNKAAIDIANNPVQHDRTKHVEIDRHFIREKIDHEIVCLPFVKSSDQLADVLTKRHSPNIFLSIMSKMCIQNIYSPS